MFERFVAICPTVLFALTAIFAGGWWLYKKHITSENLEERLTDVSRELSKFGVIAIVVAPCIEETVFRAPLIVAFPTFTPTAWLMLCDLGVVFGYTHVTAMHTQLFKKLPSSMKNLLLGRLWHVTQASMLGIGFGYFAIRFQSLLLVIAIHMTWNAFFIWNLARFAHKKADALARMGEPQEQLEPGRSFTLHLQASPGQEPYSSTFFENGWDNDFPAIESTLVPLVGGKEVRHKIYGIRASANEAHVFALPIER